MSSVSVNGAESCSRERARRVEQRPLQVVVERELAALQRIDHLAVAAVERLVVEAESARQFLALLVIPAIAQAHSAQVEKDGCDGCHRVSSIHSSAAAAAKFASAPVLA
jgi:predicted metalloprotease